MSRRTEQKKKKTLRRGDQKGKHWVLGRPKPEGSKDRTLSGRLRLIQDLKKENQGDKEHPGHNRKALTLEKTRGL